MNNRKPKAVVKIAGKRVQSPNLFEALPSVSNLHKVKATSMVELLVVIIIAGILYILIFDGAYILRRMAGRVNTAFIEKTNLLISHGIIETLFEQGDSIRPESEGLYLYCKGEPYKVIIYSRNKLILAPDIDSKIRDTLFHNLSDFRFDSSSGGYAAGDSLFLSVVSGRDTLILKYGLEK